MTLHTAFLSNVPHEPVLVFDTPKAASDFQHSHKDGRIYAKLNSRWVYLPMPKGLLRVRTASKGDVAFDFETAEAAKRFNDSIGWLGRIFAGKDWATTVYLGKEK